MKWKLTKDNEFPSEGEMVVCIAYDSTEVFVISFSTENFVKNKVRAWIKAEDIYFDFLDKAILDNGVEIMSRTRPLRGREGEKDGIKQDIDND